MRLLFVCSGNTCRSPLAEAAWRAWEMEVKISSGADWNEISVSSAGLCARNGERAASFARQIAHEWGVSLQDHRARLVMPELVAQSDLIIAMTGDQAEVLREHFSLPAHRVRLLGACAGAGERAPEAARLDPLLGRHFGRGDDPFGLMGPREDILDPFGGSLEAYQACAGEIRRCVKGLARSLAPRL